MGVRNYDRDHIWNDRTLISEDMGSGCQNKPNGGKPLYIHGCSETPKPSDGQTSSAMAAAESGASREEGGALKEVIQNMSCRVRWTDVATFVCTVVIFAVTVFMVLAQA